MSRFALVLLVAVGACRPQRAERPADSTSGGATKDTTPYVILTPAHGAVWFEGQTYTIRWIRRRPGSVNVSAVAGGKDKGHIALDLPAGTDSLAWQVPNGFISGFGPKRSDAVRIRVEDAGDPAIGITSDSFTIAVPPSPAP